MEPNSRLKGFYKLSLDERIKKIKEMANLTEEEESLLRKTGALDIETANIMIENVIGTFHLPLGIATNFIINRKPYLIPMALEEPSVVAGASNAARLSLPGGFIAEASDPIMIGQVQLLDIDDLTLASRTILANKAKFLKVANKPESTMVKLGGGLKDIEVRKLGIMLVVHLLVDVRDAMGANAVNSLAEELSPLMAELAGGRAGLRILSNLADQRMAKSTAVWKKEALGERAVDGVLEAWEFACRDPYRAATHNKGVMNGIDAVAIATGNDFRALEAGAHAFASLKGYSPLTYFEKDKKGNLVGKIELPIAAGTVGGSTRTNPMARLGLKILGVSTSRELSMVLASVGLAQNFAALRALSTEGIQKGHLKLHAKNFAIMAGAKGKLIDHIAEIMIKEKTISYSMAVKILDEVKNRKSK